MLYKFKAKIHTDTISMKMDGYILGDSPSQARNRLVAQLAERFSVTDAQIHVTSMKEKRGKK